MRYHSVGGLVLFLGLENPGIKVVCAWQRGSVSFSVFPHLAASMNNCIRVFMPGVFLGESCTLLVPSPS